MQLLSVVRHAFEDDELQKSIFDYVSTHTRCAAPLKDLRSHFIAECLTVPSTSAEDLDVFQQLNFRVTFVQNPLPDADLAYIRVVDALFKSDPAVFVAVETYNRGRQSWLKNPRLAYANDRIRGRVLSVSALPRAGPCSGIVAFLRREMAKPMKDYVDRQGAMEVGPDLSLRASHAPANL